MVFRLAAGPSPNPNNPEGQGIIVVHRCRATTTTTTEIASFHPESSTQFCQHRVLVRSGGGGGGGGACVLGILPLPLLCALGLDTPAAAAAGPLRVHRGGVLFVAPSGGEEVCVRTEPLSWDAAAPGGTMLSIVVPLPNQPTPVAVVATHPAMPRGPAMVVPCSVFRSMTMGVGVGSLVARRRPLPPLSTTTHCLRTPGWYCSRPPPPKKNTRRGGLHADRGGLVVRADHGVPVPHGHGPTDRTAHGRSVHAVQADRMVTLHPCGGHVLWGGDGAGEGLLVDFSGCAASLLQHRLDTDPWRTDATVPLSGLLYLRRWMGSLRVGILPLGLCRSVLQAYVMDPKELGIVGQGILHHLPKDTYVTYSVTAQQSVLLLERCDGRRNIRIASQPAPSSAG